MNIAIVGVGYVGLVSAAVLANAGHNVVCIDVDSVKISQLSAGLCSFYEPQLKELIQANATRLKFTTNYAKVYRNIKDGDIIMISVGTPEKADGSADLSYVYNAAGQIAECVRANCIVVVKSTVTVGTNDELEKYINRQCRRNGINVDVVSNPEFLSQGTAIRDMMHGDRIIVGTNNPYARSKMRELYAGFESPIVFTDRRSAEMAKYASNNFLALKVSYINEIANLCEELGANIDDVAKSVGLDSRIGCDFLKAGIGYGGSCFPKDTKALYWLGKLNNREIKTIKAAIEVNSSQKLLLLNKAKKYYDSFDGLTAAILGLAFKPETDDIREAAALYNVPALLNGGATVKAWDKRASHNFAKQYPDVIYCDTIRETLRDADICFIFTEWKEILEMPLDEFCVMRNPIIVDGRNCFKPTDMSGRGYIYESVGRKADSSKSKARDVLYWNVGKYEARA